MKPARIILIRHAESAGNVDKGAYGHTPGYALELSPLEEDQAAAAGPHQSALVGDPTVFAYISKLEGETCFVLLPRRLVVERSFAWLSRFRRLGRDYKRLIVNLQQLSFVVLACFMLARHAASASQALGHPRLRRLPWCRWSGSMKW